jgi:hypothetical protein
MNIFEKNVVKIKWTHYMIIKFLFDLHTIKLRNGLRKFYNNFC